MSGGEVTSNGASNMQAAGADDAPKEEVLIRMARPKLRSVDESQFTPLVVPIGPYHPRAPGCSSQLPEEKKQHAADKVLRPGHMKRAKTMDELNKLLAKAKACYPDLSARNSRLLENQNRQEFVQMLLHDGCYVLSFLVDYKSASDEAGSGPGPGPGPVVMREENWVMRDTLFLLENQVPWFVLEKLHHCIVGNEDRSVLEDLSLCVRSLLKDRLHTSGRPRRLPASASDDVPSTLLHLVHAYFMPTEKCRTKKEHLVLDVASEPQSNPAQGATRSPSRSLHRIIRRCCPPQLRARRSSSTSTAAQGETVVVEESPPDITEEVPPTAAQGNTVVQPRVPSPRRRMGRWRRATEYCRYGNVKLKRLHLADDDGEADSVLDVSLQGRTLLMPCLLIDSATWTLLRNLMALEERMDRRPVTAYCVFMSQLAGKAEDVELLQRAGVVQHFLGNDGEVVNGFADLCREVVLDVDSPDENYLNPNWNKLQELCQSKWNNFRGFFREIHCDNDVHFFAFVGAVLLFLFQLAQVMLAGFSLHNKQPK
ncbi:uncharacterized protein LOC104582114 [Brachypodium distachyon]|uniref:Uncharacterized protein n=1 Tax=Brachypodium distachyon TaxID=15368 RepID=A0A0Q3RWF9_BRADI|nr:uncharacterized protein LOC104582114 [Brachypodium distachyon]KQK17162.1 hypothetical protein BRADI_1g32790v3 [Brachypodium distachyon]|eukprot:XP_010229751.2 uncharacterized protein LOC104582114 [Brachypodium distachyon]